MLLSPATPLTPAPMQTLPLPVMLKPAESPIAVLLPPVTIVSERLRTDGCIEFACGATKERGRTNGRVVAGCCVAQERIITVGRVIEAGGVVKERTNAAGCVAVAVGVIKKRECSIGCVLDTSGVAQSAPAPVAVFCCPVLARRVPAPTPVLNWPSWLLMSENKPTAVLYVPAVRLRSAFRPSAVFPPG